MGYQSALRGSLIAKRSYIYRWS